MEHHNRINAILLAAIAVTLFGLIFYALEPSLVNNIAIWIILVIVAGFLWFPIDSYLNFLKEERARSARFKERLVEDIPQLKKRIAEVEKAINGINKILSSLQDSSIRHESEIEAIQRGIQMLSPSSAIEMIQVCQNLIAEIETFIVPIPETIYRNWKKKQITLLGMIQASKQGQNLDPWINNSENDFTK